MTIEDVVDYINSHEDPLLTPEMDALVLETCARTHRLTMQLNTTYHEPDELRAILSDITGEEIDPSFSMFPPFYSDFGRNIHFGKNVFVNDCCHFQDQGGIFIGDNTLIGHNTVLATIDHDLDPTSRRNHYAPRLWRVRTAAAGEIRPVWCLQRGSAPGPAPPREALVTIKKSLRH